MISALGLRYFGQVVRSGSFRGAADCLYVAPSAISRQIALLEEELDAPLLERGRGRSVLKLTSAGEILMQLVNTTDNEMERVRSDIEALKGIRRGHVHLGAPETFSRDFLPDFLASFNEQFPGITYRVTVHGTPRLVQMLAADELDVALSFNPPLQTEVTHIYEHILPTRLLVPAGHPLFQRESVRLSDCAEYGLALPDASIGAKQIYDDMFAKAGIRPRAVLVTNSYELLRSAAAAGLAISLVNEFLSRRPEVQTGHRYIPIKDARVKPQRMTLCVRKGRSLSVVALTFIEHLLQAFKQLETS